jgi:hypothetical protein
MNQLVDDIQRAMMFSSHVGAVVAGLAVLRRDRGDVVIIGGPTSLAERIPVDLIGIDFEGLTFDREPWVSFGDMTSFDDGRGGGEPCVCWSNGDVRTIVAPAVAPDPDGIAATVKRFVENWCPSSENLYLSDIDGSTGDGSQTMSIEDGSIHVMGMAIAVSDLTWADVVLDGDGNTFLDLVTADARYLRIGLGDLSR